MQRKNKTEKEKQINQYVNVLRSDLLKSCVVKDYYKHTEKINRQQLSFEDFVEDRLIQIHTAISASSLKV